MDNLTAIFEHINNLIVLLSPKGEALYVSPSAKKLLGYAPEVLLGDGWWEKTSIEALHEATKEAVLSSAFQHNNPNSIAMERQVKTSYGDKKWFLWNSYINEDGNILSVGTDISERKKTEERLHFKNIELSELNSDLMDSIEYAQRLQEVILPKEKKYKQFFSDAFVLFKPKDGVSGDFHWYYENENYVTVAAVDCTGHGIPGAMLSIVGNLMLKDIVIKNKIYDPGEVLLELDKKMILAMSDDEELKARDGMDIAFVTFDKRSQELHFAGAFRSLLHIDNDHVVHEIAGSRSPIGFYEDSNKEFSTVTVRPNKGDRFYLFSDGYADQFGGPKGKKIKKSQLKEILRTTGDLNMSEQHDFLDYSFINWKQRLPQTDDVLVIGLEI